MSALFVSVNGSKKQGCLEHCILKSYTFAALCKAEGHFL